jgi:hypothetical protein
VSLRAGLDDVKKRKFFTLLGLELRLLGHPARSQSLYRLSYPGSYRISYILRVHLPGLSSDDAWVDGTKWPPFSGSSLEQ